MSNIKVAIINLNISNVGSISRALRKINYNSIVTNNIKDLENSSHIIFPGVGSFDKGVEKLKKFKLFEELYKLLIIKKKPFLGICLGMQLLGSIGVENNKEEKGLDIIKGKIIRLEKKNEKMKIPHVGWNEVKKIKNNEIFTNINDKSDFYFIHSFHLKLENIEDNISSTNYGKDFVSAVNKQNIYGVQFHPEKSLGNGLLLIKNFINYNA
jgi:imidazole glycerol-phosphate synthase subunit HisH